MPPSPSFLGDPADICSVIMRMSMGHLLTAASINKNYTLSISPELQKLSFIIKRSKSQLCNLAAPGDIYSREVLQGAMSSPSLSSFFMEECCCECCH